MVNKTFHDLPIEVKLNNIKGELKFVGPEPSLLKQDAVLEGVFFVVLPKSDIVKIKTPITISIVSNGQILDEIKTNFLGPNIN